ncbi:hypothetical protein AN639_12295 [Candidatus Epulonipiscium fishelsonii]|nr:hypothetical protein AN639_12295 [Epulopiscium sp. SCG-B05WGA-EpuloA1]
MKLLISFLVMVGAISYSYHDMRAEENSMTNTSIAQENNNMAGDLTLSETGKEIKDIIKNICDEDKELIQDIAPWEDKTRIDIKLDKVEGDKLYNVFNKIIDVLLQNFETEKLYEENRVIVLNDEGHYYNEYIDKPKSISTVEEEVFILDGLSYTSILKMDNQIVEIEYYVNNKASKLTYEYDKASEITEVIRICLYHTNVDEEYIKQINDEILIDTFYLSNIHRQEDSLKFIEYINQEQFLVDALHGSKDVDTPSSMQFYISFDGDIVDRISVNVVVESYKYRFNTVPPLFAITEAEEQMLKNIMEYANIDEAAQDKLLTQFKQDIQNPSSKQSTIDGYDYNTYYIFKNDASFKLDIML